MRRLLLVANPAASGFTGSLYREVVAMLTGPYAVETVWPTTPEEAHSRAAEAADDGFALVAAYGGDGVTHHVANGIVGTPTALGIIPAGTTNVLARILGVPQRPRAAAQLLAADPPLRTIPAAHVLTDSAAGVRDGHALFAVGAGYDAEVVALAEQQPFRKLRMGGVHYARSAAWVLWSRFRDRLPHLRVETDGRRADAVGVLVQVHWPYTYFGRLPLSVSRARGGGLSVLVIEELRLARVPSIAARAALGRSLERVPGLEVWSGCAKVLVQADPPVWLQSDGELQGQIGLAEISYAPDRLLVAAPPEEEE